MALMRRYSQVQTVVSTPTESFATFELLTRDHSGAHWGNKYNVFDMAANEPGLLTLRSWTTDFMVMVSIEPNLQSSFDGALRSQRVVLS